MALGDFSVDYIKRGEIIIDEDARNFGIIEAKMGSDLTDTFGKDQHKDLKADYIMANPPFNQKDWRASDELTSDPRWAGYETPPQVMPTMHGY
jgi:hypothetical protein